MRSVTLNSRLLFLAAAAILPLALMSAIALHALLTQQRMQIEQTTMGMTRALASAVDTEMRLAVSALQTLALTEQIGATGAEQLEGAHALARAVRQTRPEWRGVVLVKPTGEVIFDSEQAFDGVPKAVVEPASLAQVVATRTPQVGPLVRGPRGNFAFAIRVPVVRGGETRYILSAIVSPDAIAQVIARQRIPDDWVVSVFDSANKRVVRSRDHARYLGGMPAPTLQAMLAGLGDRNEAVGITSTLEGDESYTAVARLQPLQWTVALSASTVLVQSTVWRSAGLYGGGILLSLALGTLAAWHMSRSIMRPVEKLRENAIALGAGKPLQPQASGMPEIDTAFVALEEAAALRAMVEGERQRLLDAERSARASAEAAQVRLQVLAHAGSMLSRSLEEDSTLAAIAAAVVPALADLCRIDLLDADGVLQRRLTHHRDADRARAIDTMVRSGVVSADTPGSFPWAMATGQMYLQNFSGPEAVEVEDATFRAFVRTVGMRAICVVPLVARGRTIGAMAAIQAESGRGLSADDGALVSELGQRAALALANARLFAESRAALDHAEVANRSKDEFLAMLGHELRNPLAPIVAALELIRRRDASAFMRERQIIERQVRHLSRMVDDLLDVSRIVSGKIQIHFERVGLQDIVDRAIELTQPVFEKRSSPLELIAPDAPLYVRGDPVRLAQVLCNLLSNAAKFTPSEGRITVAWQRSGDDARLEVADQGIGMPESLLPHVFERFVQGEQAFERSKGGLGLGLAIARSLVTLHGGTIHAESAGIHHGSRFVVTLPIVDLPEPAAGRLDRAPERKAMPAARLLVVDDNADAAQMLASLLRLEGHDVRTAESAEDALALMDEFVPAAAILDLGLPGMNGYELAQALRADPRVRPSLLIALTGYGQYKDRQRALAAGFDEHMVKPVRIDLLLQRLGQHFAAPNT